MTVIVMLILAGVSLNALVGDNGIITNAQQATVQSGMAALEEYLQEKYVEYYDEAEEYTNKQELLANKIPGLFFKDGTRNFIINDNKVYYIINKSKLLDLSKELYDNLKGGDTNEYSKYTRLIDVYGVTDDLRVFYYNSDDGTTYGTLASSNLDISNIKAASINNDYAMKTYITTELAKFGIIPGNDGVTISDASILDDLEIDGSTGITSLNGLQDVKGLRILTLTNMNLTNLSGLEGCPSLYYIYLKNCKIDNYSALSSVIRLQYLYLYLPPTMAEAEANEQVENLGNGLENANNLNKLEYFGISGDDYLFEERLRYNSFNLNDDDSSYNRYNNNDRVGNLSSITPLNKFNSTIKNSIKTLYLNCNNITDISSLKDFNGIWQILLIHNANLQSLSGLENHSNLECAALQSCDIQNLEEEIRTGVKVGLTGLSKLKYLSVQNNIGLTSLKGLEGSTDLRMLLAYGCDLTNITALAGCTELSWLSMNNSTNLQNVITLKNCEKLDHLYLENNENMIGTEVRDALQPKIFAQLGQNYSIPQKYMIYFRAVAKSLDYSVAKAGVLNDDSDEMIEIYGRTNVERLNLSNQTELTDDLLQDTLGSLTGLQALSLVNCTSLESIDFAENLTDLRELDLRGCNVTDLSKLNSLTKLGILILSNSSTDFSNLGPIINVLYERMGYDISSSWIINNQQHLRGLVLEGDLSLYDFDGCSASKFVMNNFKVNKSGVLDLSMTTIEYIHIAGYTSFKAPKSVVDVYCNYSTGDLSLCDDLKKLITTHDGVRATVKSISTSAQIEDLELQRDEASQNLSYLSGKDLSKLERIYLHGYGSTMPILYTSLSGLENATNLKKFYMNYGTKINDISALDNCINLETIVIIGCPEIDFSLTKNQLKSCTLIKNMYIDSCSLNNLEICIEKTLLEYIRFTNDNITDISGISGLTNLRSGSFNFGGEFSGKTTMLFSGNKIRDLSPLLSLIVYSDATDSIGRVNFSYLGLDSNKIVDKVTQDNSNIDTLLKLKKAGMTKLILTNNLLYKGQADDLVNESGLTLSINYLDEE